MESTFSLGDKLRQLRSERNISQRDLANLAGLSSNSISLIERDVTSPNVSTLRSLATALNVRMSYFFEEETPVSGLHINAGSRPKIENEGVMIEGMGKRLPLQELGPFSITLAPAERGRLSIQDTNLFIVCRGRLNM